LGIIIWSFQYGTGQDSLAGAEQAIKNGPGTFSERQIKTHFLFTRLINVSNSNVIAINIPSDVMTIITTADVGLKSELVERGF
jgi:hypothetical protein